jgi:hypothetical protein
MSTQNGGDPYAFLYLAAEALEDMERTRIAAENRARALTHPDQHIGLPEDHPQVVNAQRIAKGLADLEHEVELDLCRVLRATPLGPWVKQTIGVGEKQAGRLLGVIGDPHYRTNPETGEITERTVGQLWAYCGYSVERVNGHGRLDTHDRAAVGVAPHRRKGQQGNWNPDARKRAWLIAGSCIKHAASPYRPVYDAGREKYLEAKHEVPCPQCGPAGKPAQSGSDLSDGHKHARALRLVAKAVLKDLWIAAG